MTTNSLYCNALAFCLLTTSAVSANLLDDPGFELATGGTQTSNSAWTLTVNFPDGVSSAAQFQTAPWASDPADPNDGVGTGVWLKAFEGNQIGGEPTADATLTQTVGNVVGGTYELTFSVKRELNFTARQWFAELNSNGTGGTDTLDLLAVVPTDAAWHTYTLSLAGVSAGDDVTVRVEMRDGVDAQVNPQSAFIDNFVLTPEPCSLTLLGIGTALIGLRRRQP